MERTFLLVFYSLLVLGSTPLLTANILKRVWKIRYKGKYVRYTRPDPKDSLILVVSMLFSLLFTSTVFYCLILLNEKFVLGN